VEPSLISLVSLVLVGALIWLSACGAFLWSVGTQELPEDAGFGYYRDFSIARKAIEASPCVGSIEYSRHEDVTLEDFHFMIRTRSGLWARLWFYEGVDVAAVCSKPEGFVVLHPSSQSVSQVYSDAELATHLRERGVHVANVSDLLCNLDELARVFEPKYNNEVNGRITHDYEPSVAIFTLRFWATSGLTITCTLGFVRPPNLFASRLTECARISTTGSVLLAVMSLGHHLTCGDQFAHIPNVVCDSRFHRRGNAHGLINAARVVEGKINGNRRVVVSPAFRECDSESSHSPILHSHRSPRDIESNIGRG